MECCYHIYIYIKRNIINVSNLLSNILIVDTSYTFFLFIYFILFYFFATFGVAVVVIVIFIIFNTSFYLILSNSDNVYKCVLCDTNYTILELADDGRCSLKIE